MSRAWRRVAGLAYGDYCLAAGRRHLALRSDDVLLDVGGGGAYYLARLAGSVRLGVLVDRFADMYAGALDQAARARRDHAFSVVCADAHRLPFADGSATKLFANQVLEHLDDPARFVAEAARVLKPGGVAVVISQNAAFLAGHRFRVRRVLRSLVPRSWYSDNAFMRDGYEAWERAVGHLHRFTREDYRAMASSAGFEVARIEAVHGRLSMVLWECEAAVMHRARPALWVRRVSRGLLQPVTRAIERLGGGDGLDLIGVFRKPAAGEARA